MSDLGEKIESFAEALPKYIAGAFATALIVFGLAAIWPG